MSVLSSARFEVVLRDAGGMATVYADEGHYAARVHDLPLMLECGDRIELHISVPRLAGGSEIVHAEIVHLHGGESTVVAREGVQFEAVSGDASGPLADAFDEGPSGPTAVLQRPGFQATPSLAGKPSVYEHFHSDEDALFDEMSDPQSDIPPPLPTSPQGTVPIRSDDALFGERDMGFDAFESEQTINRPFEPQTAVSRPAPQPGGDPRALERQPTLAGMASFEDAAPPSRVPDELADFDDGNFTGIVGSLKALRLAEVVQAMEVARKTVRIQVKPSGADAGVFFLQHGQLVYGKWGSLEGEEAFYDLARHEHGVFRIDMDLEAPAQNISRPSAFLMLEAMRRLDEERHEDDTGMDDGGFEAAPTQVFSAFFNEAQTKGKKR